MRHNTVNTYNAGNITPPVKKHIKSLGFRGVNAYLSWCDENKFSYRLKKNYVELEAEQNFYASEQVALQKHMKMHRNPDRFFKGVCAGCLSADEISRLGWTETAESIEKGSARIKDKKGLSTFLCKLNRKGKFVFETVRLGRYRYRYIDALIKIYIYRSEWMCDLDEWAPTSHNMHAQFRSLLHHLFAKYDVPEFLDSAWFRKDEVSRLYRQAYVHIGKGRNIRKANMPVTITKKMAHFMLQAPANCSVEQAVNWAAVKTLGGNECLCNAILGSRIGKNLDNHEFWISVFRFFVEYSDLETRHVGPIIDYIYAQRFEVRECAVSPDVVHYIYPPQPNLCMNGRTSETLLKQVEAWHKELGKSMEAQKYIFKPSGIRGYVELCGEGGSALWRIRELLSGAELVTEGRAMNHCVATYARDCSKGWSSIWTLEIVRDTGIKKHLTIEVYDSAGELEVFEVRGKNNRPPTREEFKIVKRWAHAAGLAVCEYIEVEDS